MDSSLYALWLVLIEVAANGDEKFAPTADQQRRIDALASDAAINAERLGRLIDRAMRFAQVQAAIIDLLPAEATFARLESRLSRLENIRARVVEQIKANRRSRLRLQTLRAESERIQLRVAHMNENNS